MNFEKIPTPEEVADDLGIPRAALRRAIDEIYYRSPDLSWAHVEQGRDRLAEAEELAARLLEALSGDREFLRLVDFAGEEAPGLAEAVEKLRDAAGRAHRRLPPGRPPLSAWMYNAAEQVRQLCEEHGVPFTADFFRDPTVRPRSHGARLLVAVVKRIDSGARVESCRTLARWTVEQKKYERQPGV